MSVTNELGYELSRLEGLHGQHPEDGSGIGSGKSYIHEYTNRIFGAPFQLMDSVDRRFDTINTHLGNEYLRNFLLNSPILHIKPGMPKYTGGTDATSLASGLKNIYMDTTQGGMSLVGSTLDQLAASTIFGKGSKLQKRMFGFRETYYQYMQHVNYMCRSMAVFLGLTEGTRFPTWTFTSTGEEEFSSMKWENYRMMASSTVPLPTDYLGSLVDTTALGAIKNSIGAGIEGAINVLTKDDGESIEDIFKSTTDEISQAWGYASKTHLSDVMKDKISAVEFMVEPVQFSESLDNTTAPSMIESTLESISDGVGAEIAFITNSSADLGLIENIVGMLGDTVSTAASALNGLVENVAGGFTANLFSGAIQSIKGQKMIYPEIYKNSKSHMDYQFSVTLTTPYGDIYNYYMNIVVPLMHLIALTAPRMVTSNTLTSPFLVQAYIPGMCTCQLGIIQQMNIQKNPTTKHVSVQGFPLTVRVEFTIRELYNALAISPANDPASFLFNETLNDYMANLAGLAPSIDTYTKQRKNAFANMEAYIKGGGFAQDIAQGFIEKAEDMYNPFVGR